MHVDWNNSKQDDRVKALVIYNTFDALHLIDDADEHSGDPNTSNPLCNDPYHQLALKDLVSEYRLHFLGILETHNVVDVHILDLGDQFIHCRVTNRATNEHVIITVIYGASEVVDRRNLWSALETATEEAPIFWWRGSFHYLCKFPTSYYHSLTPRTSDHSPLVIHGDTQHNGGTKPVFRMQRRNKGDLTLNVQLAKGFLDEAQQLVSSDRQNELYLLLEHCCRIIYAKAAKLEQFMLQQRAKMQWMKDGDQCSRVFFRKIAQRRVMRRILQINDENGTTHSNPEENLLGGTRRRETVNIQYLRPWARHCITDEEANHLLLPFSTDDVKQAVFDIVEDKASGPDGYSSGFFKAAWPVVGEEVTRAVLDFFSNGKILKQINSTILALIPKKISAKLLVQRIIVLLDKIVSPCQTAFIPGRSIGDNIMLAQELFSRYNQMRLPPRCALKVDIRKAYDTVEWDFLLAVLQLFGFAPTFTRWIEECVSTTSFSIGLNGKPHGFFSGARGLRQGDPLSPYLVFKEGLDWFAELSGLRLNVHKSHLIILRSAQELNDLLEILGFQEGHLPMRYLGLPLISSRLSISNCQPLISKIDARINGWEGISLSYAGLVQIIKSILLALSLYWASAFILPKKVINEIEKRLRTFLWNGTTSSGYAKVAWKDVCRPTDEGGLGFKDISTLNRALMSKKLCDVIRCDRTSIWVQWIYQDRLRDTSIWTVQEHGGSWGWRKMLRLHPFLRSMFPRGPNHLGIEEIEKLSSVISAGEWQWPTIMDFECLEITHNRPFILGGEDRVVWRFDGGQPTTQALYRLFDPPEPKVGWSLLLSGSFKIPRHSFILWLAIIGKLPSTDKLWLSHLGACILCNEGATESHTHLFFRCRYSRQCLLEIRRWIRFHWPNRDWSIDIDMCLSHMEGKELEEIYTLPQIHARDDRIIWRFPDGRPTAQALYRLICPPGPKVDWTSLLLGLLKIPRHCFILWMAIQEKLPTIDKPWLTHIGGCILCDEEATEMHNHLFFRCRFSRRCLIAIREIIRFAWPNRTWVMDVEWAVRKWRGKHIINAAYRALLGSFIYHLWRERNSRRFQQIEHPPNVLASLIIDDVRQRILSLNLSSSISTCALYRLWQRNLRRFEHTERTPATLSFLISDDVKQRILSVNLASSVSTRAFFWEGNGVILAGNDIDLRTSSSSLGLGFRAAEEFERAHEEDETTLDVSAKDDDGVRVSNVREDLPMEKGMNLDATLEDTVRCPNLGLGDAPSQNNNGGQKRGLFNMVEFIRLAQSVIDAGDNESMSALEELKSKWESRFGKKAVVRCFPTIAPVPHRAWRNLMQPALGDRTMEKRTELQSVNPSSRSNFSGKFGEQNSTKTMAIVAGSVSGSFLTTLTEIRPATTGNDVLPARMEMAPESVDMGDDAITDVTTDVTADMGHDTGAGIIADMGHDTGDEVTADRGHDTDADAGDDVSNKVEKNRFFAPKFASTSTGLFVGNIPLHANSNLILDDKIARDFNNSSHKTLSYIAPTVQNGEVVVRPSIDTIREGSKRWKSTAVGYFLGKRPYYHHLKEYAQSVWPALREVTATVNDFFFFQFKIVIDMEEVIEGGPWLFQGQPNVHQKWEPGMAMRKLKHTEVPVWIKLRHLSMEFWTTEGLSIVASGVGKPLYPNAITKACTRLDFAHVCVMIDVNQQLINHIIIMTPDNEGGETPCKVDIEYEWLPLKCTTCMTMGHTTKDLSVYVPKVNVAPPIAPEKGHNTRLPPIHDQEIILPSRGVDNQRDGRNANRVGVRSNPEEKGKEIVIYNMFDALHLLDDADKMSWGPNHKSPNLGDPYHQLAIKDIVAEFRLQFLGLLETRVRINNVAGIQSFLLPQGKWFVNYGVVGNRIWIAWDENFLDFDVVECVAITVIYGATEVADRRELWDALETIAMQSVDVPWLIGGDFNAV
ncbi:UNVERIFIED_CONTAM: hypothetical protein Sindi_3029000 [Sesamum indicum]